LYHRSSLGAAAMSANRAGRLQAVSLLWMVSGLVLWAVHFAAVYLLLSLGCALSFATTRVAGVYLINLAIVLITVPLLLAIVYLGWSSWRYWRAVPREADRFAATRRAMAWVATMIHGLSLLAVLL